MTWPAVEVITGCYDDGPLLTRYKLVQSARLNIYLHIFHRSDEDRELHDHPWTFLSLILWRGYTEVRPRKELRAILASEGMESVGRFPDERLERKRYWPGMVLYRPAWWAHRVELPAGARSVSLVLITRKSREWGFFTRDGWKLWRSFVNSRDCG